MACQRCGRDVVPDLCSDCIFDDLRVARKREAETRRMRHRARAIGFVFPCVGLTYLIAAGILIGVGGSLLGIGVILGIEGVLLVFGGGVALVLSYLMI